MRFFKIILILILFFGIPCVSAQEQPPAKVVVTEIIRREVTENRSFVGLIYYDRVSHVSSEVSGLVEKIEVRQGDRIKKGDPLVSLDTELLDKEIELAGSKIEQIDLRVGHTEKQYRRLEKLLPAKGISEKDFEDALFAYQDALTQKKEKEVELAKLLIRKKKSIIAAPFDGIVLEKNVDVGDWLQQGKQLARIASESDLFVKVPVAETLLQFVSQGNEVPVVINAFGKEISGSIVDFDPTADAQTKNVFLKVKIPSMDKVAVNMSATVFVPTSVKKDLAIIPRDALVQFQGEDFVYTIKDGKASILPVNIVTYLDGSIGADNPYFTAGMPIVTEGNERLRPDQPVEIAGEN